jgi:hypothetical protein
VEDNRYIDAVNHFVKQNNIPDGKGVLVLGECMVCGSIALLDLDTEKDRALKLSDNTKQCQQCEQIKRRTPEVFNWVLNVLGFRDYQDKNPRPEEAKPVI